MKRNDVAINENEIMTKNQNGNDNGNDNEKTTMVQCHLQ